MRDETLEVYARMHNSADEILHYIWDPIGVSSVAEARNEYDSYIPQIVQMLFDGKGVDAIAQHLYSIEGNQMGLTVGSRPSRNTREVATILIQHYEVIQKRA